MPKCSRRERLNDVRIELGKIDQPRQGLLGMRVRERAALQHRSGKPAHEVGIRLHPIGITEVRGDQEARRDRVEDVAEDPHGIGRERLGQKRFCECCSLDAAGFERGRLRGGRKLNQFYGARVAAVLADPCHCRRREQIADRGNGDRLPVRSAAVLKPLSVRVHSTCVGLVLTYMLLGATIRNPMPCKCALISVTILDAANCIVPPAIAAALAAPLPVMMSTSRPFLVK